MLRSNDKCNIHPKQCVPGQIKRLFTRKWLWGHLKRRPDKDYGWGHFYNNLIFVWYVVHKGWNRCFASQQFFLIRKQYPCLFLSSAAKPMRCSKLSQISIRLHKCHIPCGWCRTSTKKTNDRSHYISWAGTKTSSSGRWYPLKRASYFALMLDTKPEMVIVTWSTSQPNN